MNVCNELFAFSFEVPEEVFMVIELTENALESVEGVVQYSSAFAE